MGRKDDLFRKLQGMGRKGKGEAAKDEKRKGRGAGGSHAADYSSHIQRTRRFGRGG